uniref:Uncharacterized protein n=1 Tax=Sphaeramia orbicularis TaxID=375764 RepID=A0A673A5Y8_9TELE
METMQELIPFAKEMLSQKPARGLLKVYLVGSVFAVSWSTFWSRSLNRNQICAVQHVQPTAQRPASGLLIRDAFECMAEILQDCKRTMCTWK